MQFAILHYNTDLKKIYSFIIFPSQLSSMTEIKVTYNGFPGLLSRQKPGLDLLRFCMVVASGAFSPQSG